MYRVLGFRVLGSTWGSKKPTVLGVRPSTLLVKAPGSAEVGRKGLHLRGDVHQDQGEHPFRFVRIKGPVRGPRKKRTRQRRFTH